MQTAALCGPATLYGPTPAAELDALAARVSRLHQGHRDPEAFYEQRSEIAGELRRLARALGANPVYGVAPLG